jgi:hypothetical protein
MITEGDLVSLAKSIRQRKNFTIPGLSAISIQRLNNPARKATSLLDEDIADMTMVQ